MEYMKKIAKPKYIVVRKSVNGSMIVTQRFLC